MKADIEVKTKMVSLSLDELISLYELSNHAEGKSAKTVNWYSEMLMTFSGYMKEELE